ncbi:MAG: NAD(+)/NADH kinase [Acidimicrobiales bacterium]|jgi:hypothetical protein|nr:NAD(+)/NADH kinase [Acidimicrobiales bacterium]HJM29096.1 NAD(+)/NADH kinase [Acidimicrobiales bacterium]HJM97411.1 NAD(+)/NADH kinase [Acidimicrobiales bacterium]
MDRNEFAQSIIWRKFNGVNDSVGIIVNPRSGGDVRRAVAAAGRSTVEEKVSIVRRIVLGAMAVGVENFFVNYEPMQIVRRATETIRGIEINYVNDTMTFTEEDSTIAARRLNELGVPCAGVLGGDGTNRAVVKGWQNIPVIPVSTGTNNAFPAFIEPTVAGTSLGLVATGAVSLNDVSVVAKLIHVSGEDEISDIALIDAVAVNDPYVGSLELFDPKTMNMAILTQADPAAIGFSSVGGLLKPLTAIEDSALYIRFAPVGSGSDMTKIKAPTAPGHYDTIGVEKVTSLSFGEEIPVTGEVLLAFDGERKLRVPRGKTVTLSVRRDGPQVIDPAKAMSHGRHVMIDG